jgi:hypothetical protein
MTKYYWLRLVIAIAIELNNNNRHPHLTLLILPIHLMPICPLSLSSRGKTQQFITYCNITVALCSFLLLITISFCTISCFVGEVREEEKDFKTTTNKREFYLSCGSSRRMRLERT